MSVPESLSEGLFIGILISVVNSLMHLIKSIYEVALAEGFRRQCGVELVDGHKVKIEFLYLIILRADIEPVIGEFIIEHRSVFERRAALVGMARINFESDVYLFTGSRALF